MPFSMRYCAENTVSIINARPPTQVTDLCADFLCAWNRTASKAEVSKQLPLQVAKTDRKKKLTGIIVDLPTSAVFQLVY